MGREYADFFLALSAAFQGCQIYPGGHPSVDRAVDQVLARLEPLLAQLSVVVFAVAPTQLSVSSAATDPEHVLLRDLAGRLFRRNVGAVRISRGVTRSELAAFLEALTHEREIKALPPSLHVGVESLNFEGLSLRADAGSREPRAESIWAELARAVEAAPQERLQAIAGVLESADASAAVGVLQAAARKEGRTLSPALLQVLGKLASHAQSGAAVSRQLADDELRAALRALMDEWKEPAQGVGADDYAETLDQLPAPDQPDLDPTEAYRSDPLRLVTMHLDMGELAPPACRAVRTLVARGKVRPLVDLLGELKRDDALREPFMALVATTDALVALLASHPIDLDAVEKLAPDVGVAAIPPLLEALAGAGERTVRRRLMDLLGRFGNALTPLALEQLPLAPWYVQRNLLRLLQVVPDPPAEAAALVYATDPDARVRVEGLRLLLRLPAERARGIVQGLGDSDRPCVRAAVNAAAEGCPPAAAPLLIRLLLTRELEAGLRPVAVRALAPLVDEPAVLDLLLRLAGRKLPLFGFVVAPKTKTSLAALGGLARHWRWHPRTARLLNRAERHRDPAIRAVVTGPTILEQLGIVENTP